MDFILAPLGKHGRNQHPTLGIETNEIKHLIRPARHQWQEKFRRVFTSRQRRSAVPSAIRSIAASKSGHEREKRRGDGSDSIRPFQVECMRFQDTRKRAVAPKKQVRQFVGVAPGYGKEQQQLKNLMILKGVKPLTAKSGAKTRPMIRVNDFLVGI